MEITNQISTKTFFIYLDFTFRDPLLRYLFALKVDVAPPLGLKNTSVSYFEEFIPVCSILVTTLTFFHSNKAEQLCKKVHGEYCQLDFCPRNTPLHPHMLKSLSIFCRNDRVNYIGFINEEKNVALGDKKQKIRCNERNFL